MASAVALGVAPTERAPSVLPAAGEPRLAEAPPALDESSPTNRKEPNFKELTERFDSLLLEGAELLNMSADELTNGGDECAGYETLEEAFAALGMDADAYAVAQSLMGLTIPAAGDASAVTAVAQCSVPAAVAHGAAVAQPDDERAHAATVRIQAAIRGSLVRLGFAEACTLYFGASSPPNA